MSFSENCNQIFNQAIEDYHVKDNVDTPINNPYDRESINNRLYLKCWIDTVQWHLEDIIRDPHIDPADALSLKRRIDLSNQDRTDLVERMRVSTPRVRLGPWTDCQSWPSKSTICANRLSALTPTKHTQTSAEPN